MTAADIHIVPKPLSIQPGSGTYTLKDGVDGPDVAAVKDSSESSLGDEGYDLTVTGKGVTIKSPTDAGLFYGKVTLKQLIGPDNVVPAVHIVDKPRFPYRGLMLDSGRHIQSVEYIKTLIDRMADLKMNRFHWHLTEDQGWRIEIKKYPRLTEFGAWREKDGQRYGGFFTQDQIKDVVAYAQARFITVIPEIEMPGHSTAAVASYPWLGCTGKQFPVRWDWGISPHVYCPAKETTYEFCENVLAEVMGLFPSSTIHIGGDECPKDEWKADPGCQALIKKLGLKDEDALQGYFTTRIAKFLESHGRHLQGWNEIMNGTDLPKGVIVQQWNAPHSATLAAQAGLDVVASPTSHCYLDYPYVQITAKKVLEFEPVPADLDKSLVHHILGPEGELWTEHMDDEARVDYMAFPRAVALAEVAWSPAGEKSWDDFKTRCQAWIARQPADQQKGLEERLNFGTYYGNRIGAWGPKNTTTDNQYKHWNATRYIISAGTYEVRIVHSEGGNGLAIDEVSLTPNGTTDKHPGVTGATSKDNVYTVTLNKYDPNTPYIVKATVRGNGGNSTMGAVYIKKIK